MTERKDLKIGDTFKIVGNSSPPGIGYHFFEIGEKVKFKGFDSDGDAMFEYLDGSDFWWVSLSDVSRV